jgi:hypothetical protein
MCKKDSRGDVVSRSTEHILRGLGMTGIVHALDAHRSWLAERDERSEVSVLQHLDASHRWQKRHTERTGGCMRERMLVPYVQSQARQSETEDKSLLICYHAANACRNES